VLLSAVRPLVTLIRQWIRFTRHSGNIFSTTRSGIEKCPSITLLLVCAANLIYIWRCNAVILSRVYSACILKGLRDFPQGQIGPLVFNAIGRFVLSMVLVFMNDTAFVDLFQCEFMYL